MGKEILDSPPSLKARLTKTCATNSQPVAHKSWMFGWLPFCAGILAETINTVIALNEDHKFHSLTATEHKYDKMGIKN